MQDASARFVDALTASHPIYSRATLIETDGTRTPIPIEDGGGSITLDETAATRAGLSLNIVTDDLEFWVPDDLDSPLAPTGTEIEVARGIEFADGTIEEIQLGVFRVSTYRDSVRDGEVSISVGAFDRSIRIIQAKMTREEPGVIEEGTNCGDAIKALLLVADPETDFSEFAETTVELPAIGYAPGDDRWDLCQGIAEAARFRLYYGPAGRPIFLPWIESHIAQATYGEGPGGALLGTQRELSDEEGVNRVNVSGENSSSDPAYGEAYDNDIDSKTRYGGPFGERPFDYSSPFIYEDTQAADVAQTILDKKRGIPQSIAFDALVDPRLEPNDAVLVVHEEMKIEQLHIIDSVSIPLSADGDMTCQTRQARIVS